MNPVGALKFHKLNDPHVASGLLKLYFRTFPIFTSPILPNLFYDNFSFFNMFLGVRVYESELFTLTVESHDITIASTIKIGELKEPLIPSACHEPFLKAVESKNKKMWFI